MTSEKLFIVACVVIVTSFVAVLGLQIWGLHIEKMRCMELAVKLGIELYQAHSDGEWASHAGYSTATDARIRYMVEPHYKDRYAATRRAITRAAASIGEKME